VTDVVDRTEPAPEPAPEEPAGTGDADAVPAWRRLLISVRVPVLALLTALAIGAILIIFTNPDCLYAWARFFNDPMRALSRSWDAVYDAYRALFLGAVGSKHAISETLALSTPLIFCGLSVAFAFKGGLFNIGGNGQLIAGATLATWLAITFDLPAPIHVVVCLIGAFVGGAIWGGIAGVLRATTGAHEVITTIMLNFIALRFLDYLLTLEAFLPEGQANPVSEPLPDSARLTRFPEGERLNLGFILALVAVVVVWWILRRSTWGFQVQALGINADAARYAGMRTGLLIVVTMGVAGGLAGLAGAGMVMGISTSLTAGVAGNIGFDAIAVALLGRSNPIGVLFAALLFGGLQAGSVPMQANTSTPVDIVTVIQALIIVFVAAPMLVRAIYRIKATGPDTPTFTSNWGK